MDDGADDRSVPLLGADGMSGLPFSIPKSKHFLRASPLHSAISFTSPMLPSPLRPSPLLAFTLAATPTKSVPAQLIGDDDIGMPEEEWGSALPVSFAPGSATRMKGAEAASMSAHVVASTAQKRGGKAVGEERAALQNAEEVPVTLETLHQSRVAHVEQKQTKVPALLLNPEPSLLSPLSSSPLSSPQRCSSFISATATRVWVTSAVVTFLSALCLHSFTCALSSYRFLPPLLLSVPLLSPLRSALPNIVKAVLPCMKPIPRARPNSTLPLCARITALWRIVGWKRPAVSFLLLSLSLLLIFAPLSSLPLPVTLLLAPAADALSRLVWNNNAGHGGYDALYWPHVAVVFAFIAAVSNGFTGNSMADLWVEPHIPSKNDNGSAMLVASALLVVGVMCQATGDFIFRKMITTAVMTAIDDEYYAKEREREARDKQKAAAAAAAPVNKAKAPVHDAGKKKKPTANKPSPLAMQQQVMHDIQLDVSLLQNGLRIAACVVVAPLAIVLSGNLQSLLTSVPATTGSNGKSAPSPTDMTWQLQHGFTCAFAGGTAAFDGLPLSSPLSSSPFTTHNYCPLVLPILFLFFIFHLLSRVSLPSIHPYYDPYRLAKRTDRQTHAAPGAIAPSSLSPSKGGSRPGDVDADPGRKVRGSFLFRLFSNRFSRLSFLYILASIVSTGNPLAQQASPTLLHSVCVSDAVAVVLLFVSAALHAAAHPLDDDMLLPPPTYPSAFTIHSNGIMRLTVAGLGDIEGIAADEKEDNEATQTDKLATHMVP
jgi:hypothetical protein